MKRTSLIVYEDRAKTNIHDAAAVFDGVQKINVDYNQENLLVFFLNVKNKVIDAKVLFTGGLDACIADPRTIFRHALLLNAAGLIYAHNHPSGDLRPSQADDILFTELKRCGDILRIKVLDSLIFNQEEYLSMRESKKVL